MDANSLGFSHCFGLSSRAVSRNDMSSRLTNWLLVSMRIQIGIQIWVLKKEVRESEKTDFVLLSFVRVFLEGSVGGGESSLIRQRWLRLKLDAILSMRTNSATGPPESENLRFLSNPLSLYHTSEHSASTYKQDPASRLYVTKAPSMNICGLTPAPCKNPTFSSWCFMMYEPSTSHCLPVSCCCIILSVVRSS